MPEIKELSQITSLPGIKRDGTNLDGDNFVDGQWCRWQRGRPRKIGGFQEITSPLPGIPRAVLVWSRESYSNLITGSSVGVHTINVANSGGAGQTFDRTPAGWTDFDGAWTLDSMYDDAVGSKNTILLAHRNRALQDIYDQEDDSVYWGIMNDNAPLQPIAGLSVSGGIVCISPYLVYYGSDGLVGWSDANQPQTLASGDAGQDRVTGAKVIKGLPLRSGGGPACVLWSLDSVIRMDWVGGAAIFKFSTVTNQSSILAQNSVIEYDGSYFWIGIDKFMVYTGGQVAEVPNQMNKNWFFDNVNYNQRQKIWATKVPRFGEIIWFFPFGEAEECNMAVVFNIAEKTWYDFELSRTAGYYSQVFAAPVWTGEDSEQEYLLELDTVTGSFQVGDYVVTGNTQINGMVRRARDLTGGNWELIIAPLMHRGPLIDPDIPFLPRTFAREKIVYPELSIIIGETLNNLSRPGHGMIHSETQLFSAYIHEKGRNAVFSNQELAIPSWFETADFGYPTGGAQQNNIKGLNRWTRLVRVEPDFNMSGNMVMRVVGREFAQDQDTYSPPYTFGPNSGKIDLREQRRQIRLRFESNELGGFFEMGRVILHTEPGDVRN